MKTANLLATIVAYYLSRFDQRAYDRLDFGGKTAAHKEIGRILGVKPNYVKNQRDEFDPLHDNTRVGWYQTPVRRSCARVHESFQTLGEMAIYSIVNDILYDTAYRDSREYDLIQEQLNQTGDIADKPAFTSRGRTGRAAEEFFMQYHESNSYPEPGELVDTRDNGCGYDFEIRRTSGGALCIEVKGMANESGGILFTEKEWETAQKIGDDYFLALVRNVESEPSLEFVQNPASKFNDPRRRLYTQVQVTYSISPSQLKSIQSRNP